jgi:GNAT superfamily N-acetyltransferase
MEVSIAATDVLDAEDIVREINLPAMQHGPLYRLMFPPWADMTEAQQNEIVQWYAEGLRDALRRKTVNFIQICATDGTPLGFCGWAMEHGRHAGTKQSTVQSGQGQPLLPETLDLAAWLSVSRDLRKERERVLIGLDEVCRESLLQHTLSSPNRVLSGLTFMSVHPDHQLQGLGSKMLEQVCVEIDRLRWPAFVMASPAGVRLYAKFGFDVVGRVETSEGAFTSMLRQSRPGVSGL